VSAPDDGRRWRVGEHADGMFDVIEEWPVEQSAHVGTFLTREEAEAACERLTREHEATS
jgi:hypothetical protein